MGRYNRTVIQRLEDMTIPEPNSGCWLWLGSVNEWGYGTIRIDGKTLLAHRVSWMENRGPIPEENIVCHSCDIPSCLNPDHLWLGTDKENSDDMYRKGRNRQPRGEAHRSAVLTEDQAKQIIKRLKAGEKGYKIARSIGCTINIVQLIKDNRSWKHLER